VAVSSTLSSELLLQGFYGVVEVGGIGSAVLTEPAKEEGDPVARLPFEGGEKDACIIIVVIGISVG